MKNVEFKIAKVSLKEYLYYIGEISTTEKYN